jgi:hypothetical protein
MMLTVCLSPKNSLALKNFLETFATGLPSTERMGRRVSMCLKRQTGFSIRTCDLRTTIKPVAVNLQLHVFPISSVLESYNALAAHEFKFPGYLEVVSTAGRLSVEALVNAHHLVGELENFVVGHVGKLLRLPQRDPFALDFEDILTLRCADCEIVARQGEYLERHEVKYSAKISSVLSPEGTCMFSCFSYLLLQGQNHFMR